jgi:hypothetical protein
LNSLPPGSEASPVRPTRQLSSFARRHNPDLKEVAMKNLNVEPNTHAMNAQPLRATSLGMIAVLLLACLMVAASTIAQAANLVVNGGFENTTGNNSSFQLLPGTGGPFAPDNWSVSGGIGCVTFPASTQSQTNACGPNLSSLWAGWTLSHPNDGNFVVMDGDHNWHGSLSQSISVVNGQSYQVSFLQAAAQFEFLNGATTEQ